MDIKTRNTVAALHTEVIEARYHKTQWWPMLKTQLSGSEFQELVSSAKMGLDYLLGNENVEALAVTANPWMTREMTNEYPVLDKQGKDTGQINTVVYPSWLAKMKEQKTVTRPKDLLHLSLICSIAENIDSFDDMF